MVQTDLAHIGIIFSLNPCLYILGYGRNITVSLVDESRHIGSRVLEKHPEYSEYLPVISRETVKKCVDELNMKVKRDNVVQLVMNRYELIKTTISVSDEINRNL